MIAVDVRYVLFIVDKFAGALAPRRDAVRVARDRVPDGIPFEKDSRTLGKVREFFFSVAAAG